MSVSLEDVLSGKEPVVELPKEEVETEAQESQEDEPVAEVESEPEVEESEPKGDIEEKTEPPSVESPKEVPLAAMLDERDKRKALQAKLDEYEAERAKSQEKKADFWENPEGFVDSVREELRGEFQQTLTNSLLAFSMQSASYRHTDYDAMRDSFKEAAEQNPALVDQALKASDPGEYIYSVGRQFKQLDEVGGDIDTMRERMRSEIKAELMKEMQGKDAKRRSVPTPLTDETSASAPREKVEGGPTPLENLFNHNRG